MQTKSYGRIRYFCLSVLISIIIILLICPQAVADVKIIEIEKPSLRIQYLFKKYLSVSNKTIFEFQTDNNDVYNNSHLTKFPGWIIDKWKMKPEGLFFENWRYRSITYEVFSPTKTKLALMLYNLAIFSKDLDQSVTLARFKRGAQGFHYSVEQIVNWANVLSKKQNIFNNVEKAFLEKLNKDKVLSKSKGRYRATGKIQHIIGAAPGKKRSLALNLNHERWHVMWDQNVEFREFYLGKWQGLPEAQKNALRQSFIGYNQEHEMQIVEEWAVKKKERVPLWN